MFPASGWGDQADYQDVMYSRRKEKKGKEEGWKWTCHFRTWVVATRAPLPHPRCPHPNLRYRWMSTYKAKGNSSYRWNQGCLSADPKIGRWSWIIQVSPMHYRGFKSARGRHERKSGKWDYEGWSRDVALLALKMEKGATSHRIRVASRSWKGQKQILPENPQKGTQSSWHLDFTPVRPFYNFYPTEL